MTVTIELSDEQAEAVEAKAAAQGLSVEDWVRQVAERQAQAPPKIKPHRPHIAEVIQNNMMDVPPEDLAQLPVDGASEHDHYIYGWPKRNP